MVHDDSVGPRHLDDASLPSLIIRIAAAILAFWAVGMWFATAFSFLIFVSPDARTPIYIVLVFAVPLWLERRLEKMQPSAVDRAGV
jgi:hypothetical protein